MKSRERAIIFSGYAASAAARGIMECRGEALAKRYPLYYLKKAAEELAATEEADFETGNESRSAISVTCGKDGVFGALWRLGEQLECGLCVELSDIPVRQPAIELCDLEDINPYEADSSGCRLFVSQNPGELLGELHSAGMNAVVIGYTSAGNARTVVNGDNVRFLDKIRSTGNGLPDVLKGK